MNFKILIRNKLFSHLLLTVLLSNPAAIYATEDELFFDMPIVLSANRLEQSVSDAAVSISIIDRETIEASGARTIPEVLRLIPGMQVGYSGNEFGDEPKYVIAYHGHSDQFSKQMQVLVDGRSIYEPLFGGINWKSIPVNINDIERIEVSRGPNLATYGSNSFQAAINIITRTAIEDQGSFLQSNIGNNDIADLTYRYGGNKDKLDYRVTLSTFNDAGLDSSNQFDYPDDANSNNVDYRLDYQADNSNTVSYQGGIGRNRQQTDRNYSNLFPLARTVENTTFFQFIKWENAIDQKNSILVQYYYNLSDKIDKSLSDPFSLPPFDPFILDVNGNIRTERHNLEFTHFISPSDTLKFSWGLSGQTDIARAPLYLGTEDDVKHKQFRSFANVEWHLNQRNIINFGALAEKNDVTDSELSPRLSFTHSINKQHRFRIGISQAIRSPFIYEAKGDLTFSTELAVSGVPVGTTLLDQYILGNANLENEKIISREIVYFGNFLNSALLFNARLFHDDVSDFIDTKRADVDPAIGDNVPDDISQIGDPTAQNTVLFFQNPINSETTGLELELDYHIDPSLRLIASGAIINIQSNSESITMSAPQHSFSLMATKKLNDIYSGSMSYYYVESFKWTDSRGGSNDYDTLDIRLSRSLRFNETKGSVSLVLKNLLGDYSDYLVEPDSSAAPAAVHSRLAYLDLRLSF